MTVFDFDGAFEEAFGLWRIKSGVAIARALWATRVNGETAEEATAAHQALLGAIRRDRDGGFKTETFENYLRKKHGAYLPGEKVETVKYRPPTLPARPEPVGAAGGNAELKNEIKGMWPRDPTRFPESPTNQNAAIDQAIARYGAQDTKDACLMYAHRAAGLDHPLNLATFLENEDIRFYAKAGRDRPTSVDEAEFKLALSYYPAKPQDEEAAMQVYCYRIKPEMRFGFLAAVIAYAKERRGKDVQFLKRWQNFCNEGWREVDNRRVAWDAIWCAIDPRLVGGAGGAQGPYDGSYEDGIRQFIEGFNKRNQERREAGERAISQMSSNLGAPPEDLTCTPEMVLEKAHRLLKEHGERVRWSAGQATT